MALQSVESLGPYRVVRFLGAGGMGSVYEVAHAAMGTRHAMKVLGDQYRRSAAVRERFRREAQLMFQLGAHPHIVRATDLVEEGEALGLVIDLVDGGDLGQALEARPGPLPWDEAWRILRSIVAAVAFAHENRVVHRDLKPENALLRKGGCGQACQWWPTSASRRSSAARVPRGRRPAWGRRAMALPSSSRTRRRSAPRRTSGRSGC